MNDPYHWSTPGSPSEIDRLGEVSAHRESPDEYGAVDLGSNSFHMVVARRIGDELVVFDRIRDQVQLAAGLSDDGIVSEAARERALACLARFGERLRHLPSGQVRAVGTNTLRVANQSDGFVEASAQALGHPIEVISGDEEARLIYEGVARGLGAPDHEQLVIDIGGGSTELIVGQALQAQVTHSLSMGCVSFSERFFPDGKITEKAMDAAVALAKDRLRALDPRMTSRPWPTAVGSSGTVRAVSRVIRQSGWESRGITRAALIRLRNELVLAKNVSDLDLDGLKRSRGPVLPGGLAVLQAVMETCGIERLSYSPEALREGVLYRLVRPWTDVELASSIVERLEQRFLVDRSHSHRVAETARSLLAQVSEDWKLDHQDDAHVLGWAARLHEIGLSIGWKRSHEHGAYLVRNSTFPRLSAEDIQRVAMLIETHRKELRPSSFATLPSGIRKKCQRLSVLLRLAILLHRRRGGPFEAPIKLKAQGETLEVSLPSQWLERHPLTRSLLDEEHRLVRRVLELKFVAS